MRKAALSKTEALLHLPQKAGFLPKQSPAERICFGEEGGACGYEVFEALTQTSETEWNRLLLTMFHVKHFFSPCGKSKMFHVKHCKGMAMLL